MSTAIAACVCVALTLAAVAPERARPLTRVEVGMEGRVLYRYSGGILRARAATDKAAVTARIVSAAVDGDAMLYDVRFIPQYAGRPDVRDSLERVDGLPLDDAPRAIVEVSSALPLDHDGVLSPGSRFDVPSLGGYRLALVGIGVLWIVPLGVAIAKRISQRKRPQVVIAPAPPMTVADQLRPLVESAISGQASIEEKATLERLLIAFWRERLNLQALSAAIALARIRENSEAGELLTSLECWLHRRPTPHDAAPDLSQLLRPYTARAAIAVSPASTASSTASTSFTSSTSSTSSTAPAEVRA